MQEAVGETARESNKFSDLYLACEANDSEWVKKILSNPNVPFALVNGIEPNGSTALHVAVELGHEDIIRILLYDFGVIRHRPNNNGLTAYQLAKNENVRQLFRRPSEDVLLRFAQSVPKQGDLQLIQTDYEDKNQTDIDDRSTGQYDSTNETQTENQSNDDEDNLKNQYISNYSSTLLIAMYHQVTSIYRTLTRPSRLRSVAFAVARAITWLKREPSPPSPHKNAFSLCEEVRLIIDCFVSPDDSQYKKAHYLVDEHRRDGKIEPLLRLYTLPTNLYSNLHQESNLFYNTILSHLEEFQNRYFHGTTYRGMVMDKDLLRAYEWAFEHPNCHTVTHGFMSTSVDLGVCRIYCDNPLNDGRVSVLMIFNFSQPCDRSIQLYAIPEAQLPSLSEIEDEQEVLLLPDTMFKIRKIEKSEHIELYYTIWLDNVPTINRSYFQMLKLVTYEGYRYARKRFQKYTSS